MAILMFDGFDLYAGQFATVGTGIDDVWANASIGTSGRFGGQSMASNVANVGRALPLGVHTGGSIGVGFAIRKPGSSSPTQESILRLYEDAGLATGQICVVINNDGSISISRGVTPGSNVLATSAAGLFVTSDNGWHYIEFTATIHDTTGSASVKLDGVTVCSCSGVDTKAATTVNVGGLMVCGPFRWTDVDDLYVTDGATLGERKVQTLRPSADSATINWTPSTGASNYAMVDDTTSNGDTDYVSTATVGAIDLYDLGNLPASPASIDALNIRTNARKDDAATRTYRTKLKSGATTANSATFGTTSSYAWTETLYTTDPNTSAAWTETAVNALQVGLECMA